MKNVIENLYDKYNTEVTSQLENDDFYQYFLNLLETGTTFCQFQNRKLVKEVDEEWVVAIEKAIPHIKRVIDNPRKFIEEDRQIVNVAMARKFTAESVKHLSQHSEMVNKIREDGTVEPSKVLNVFKEESLNTYENRFVYTLLYELRTFINKRIDQLFDHSKDEDGVKLNLESMVDNYTEIINYKLEMRIREKQTDTLNDDDNLGVYSRVTKLQKIINDLTTTEFFVKVGKFPRVKHPIVKTNAIGKHPDYKACYTLWNFIQSYERIGYEVRILEQDPTVSRSFEESLYNQILMDYVVVKNHMEYKDLLNINRDRRVKPLSIKDIKQFINDIVNEYDMRASELRSLVESELNNALKEKERREKMQEELLKRRKGKTKLKVEEDEGWNDFKEGATDDKMDPDQKLRMKKAEREKQKLKEQLKEQRIEELKEKKKQLEEKQNELAASGKVEDDYYSSIDEDIDKELDAIDEKIVDVMYDYMDIEKIMNGDIKLTGYGGDYVGREVMNDARFSKLLRKIEKERQKRIYKDEIIKKKYESVAESDVDKAKAILDRAKQEKDRRIKKNETARMRQIEKAKQEQEKARMKTERKKLQIQTRQDKAAARAQSKEQKELMRQEAKLAAEERRRIKLLEDERAKLARQEKREEDKKRRIEAKKQAAIDRQQRKIENKQLRAQRKIDNARRRQELKIEKQKQREANAILRKEQKEKKALIKKEQARIKAQIREERIRQRIQEKERIRQEKADAKKRAATQRNQFRLAKKNAKEEAARERLREKLKKQELARRKREEAAAQRHKKVLERERIKEERKQARRDRRLERRRNHRTKR